MKKSLIFGIFCFLLLSEVICAIEYCDSCSNCSNVIGNASGNLELYLTDNLTVSDEGSCIIINNEELDSLVFDCNDYYISGAYTYPSIDIEKSNVTIRNCNIVDTYIYSSCNSLASFDNLNVYSPIFSSHILMLCNAVVNNSYFYGQSAININGGVISNTYIKQVSGSSENGIQTNGNITISNLTCEDYYYCVDVGNNNVLIESSYFKNNYYAVNLRNVENVTIINSNFINGETYPNGFVIYSPLYPDYTYENVSINIYNVSAVGLSPLYLTEPNVNPTEFVVTIDELYYDNAYSGSECLSNLVNLVTNISRMDVKNSDACLEINYGSVNISNSILNLSNIFLYGTDAIIYNNVIDVPSINIISSTIYLNVTKTIGKNIVGGNYLGGNYWVGYSETCEDNDKDAICDNPYEFVTDIYDYLPLTNPLGDTEPPEITIYSPLEKTYNTKTILLVVSANEDIDTWWYSLNNGDNVTFIPNITISANIGSNTLFVYANDSYGNIGGKSISFDVVLSGGSKSPEYQEPQKTKPVTSPSFEMSDILKLLVILIIVIIVAKLLF